MWLLANFARQMEYEGAPPMDGSSIWLMFFLELLASSLTVVYFLFFIYMLVHCYRTEPDRQFWIWVLIIAQPIGPVAYFVLRYLPSLEFPTPRILRQWTRGRELLRLQTAAEQIGNAHQFVRWGEVLREVGQLDQARNAFDRALQKDGQDLQALWGAAQVAASQKRYADVKSLTRQLLDKNPQYKFGDVSLAYGKSLDELQEFEAARAHFEQHIRRWRHPEAMFILASLCANSGDTAAARQHLQSLIQDINGSPVAIGRKYGRWKSRARQLLRKLPA